MIHQGSRQFGNGPVTGLVGATIVLLTIESARVEADTIQLRGGGTLQGELVELDDKPDQVAIYTPSGTNPYVFDRDQIQSVEPEDGPLDKYLKRREQIKNTAQAHHELGVWCEDHDLSGPAEAHFRRAVELDDQFGPAHEKLGHVHWDGQWMTYDELREVRGLVKHDGKWVTPEERDNLTQQARLNEAQQSWDRQIALLLEKYRSDDPVARAEAERQLRMIQDPSAIVPLVNRLGEASPRLRWLLAEVLEGIDDPMAAAGLAHRVLQESDDPIRQKMLNALARRPDDLEMVSKRLVDALEQDAPEVVGRAAWALAGLNIRSAVPQLIDALVSVQHRLETRMVPAPSTGGGMQFDVGFNSFSGPSGGFIGSGRSIPVLTGPVVAPGVVAFGAQAVPLYQYGQYFQSGAGVAVGSGSAPRRMVPRQVRVPYRHQNVEVLSALQRLTDKDFGFDTEAWRRWLRTEFEPPRPDDRPGRQLPQP